MELKIIEDKKQPLFSRRFVTAELNFGEGKTPPRQDVRNELARSLKCDQKLVSVRKIDTVFGARVAKVEAYAYTSEADFEKTEPKHIKKRHAPKEQKKEEKAG